MSNVTTLIVVGAVMFAVLGGVTLLSHIYSLNSIKAERSVRGDENRFLSDEGKAKTVF